MVADSDHVPDVPMTPSFDDAMSLAPATESPIPTLPKWCSDLVEPVPLRGPTYMTDKVKVPCAEPLCTAFAANTWTVDGEHMPGASSTLLTRGEITVPTDARFVLTQHYMNPKPAKGAAVPHHVLMVHYASSTSVEATSGAAGELLRELWSGDAETSMSRVKICAGLRAGPAMLRGALAWIGLGDSARPMLIFRQVNGVVSRGTLTLPSGRTVQHIEVAFDVASSPMGSTVYRNVWSHLERVAVELRMVLEGRTDAELPERPLCGFAVSHMPASDAVPAPKAWPRDASELPAAIEQIGPVSWQSTRERVLLGPTGATTSKQAAAADGDASEWRIVDEPPAVINLS